jgi:hypothetical protein
MGDVYFKPLRAGDDQIVWCPMITVTLIYWSNRAGMNLKIPDLIAVVGAAANYSIVDTAIVTRYSMLPANEVKANAGGQQEVVANGYISDLLIDSLRLPGVFLSGQKLRPDFQCDLMLGMNVLHQFDFALSGPDQKAKLTHRD